MANTQISITANGTKTLATAGKYCDRNIDVTVNVPSSGITPSGSVNITKNGTHDVTSYASAVVNVPSTGVQPTQFTNLYDPSIVVLQQVISYSSSSGLTYGTDKQVNYIKVPYHHLANEPVVLRMRGIGTVRDRAGTVELGADGETRVNHSQFSDTNYFTLSYDEYGDATITFKGSMITKEWYYFAFNFQYPSVNSSAATALTGPIITINEPIGNGGYAG